MTPGFSTDGRLRGLLAWMVVANLVFFVVFTAYAYHSRMASDDFCFGMPSLGDVPGFVWSFYHVMAGRWLTITLASTLSTLYLPGGGPHLLFSIVTLLALAGCVGWIIRGLLRRLSLPAAEGFTPFNLGFFSVGLMFLSALDQAKGEAWFFMNGAAAYLWPALAFFVFCALWADPRRSPSGARAMIAMAGVVCSMHLIFGGVLIAAMVWGGLLTWFGLRPFASETVGGALTPRRLALLMALALLGLTVMVIAPGNYVRLENLGHAPLDQGIGHMGRVFRWTLVRMAEEQGGWFVVSGLVWLLLGGLWRPEALRGKRTGPVLAAGSLLVLGAVASFILVSTIATGGVAWRITAILAILLTFWIGFAAFTMGAAWLPSTFGRRAAPWVLALLILLPPLDLSRQLARDYATIDAYAEAYDQRMAFLKTLRDCEACREIELKPLPPSGLLHSARLKSEPMNHFIEKCMLDAWVGLYPRPEVTLGRTNRVLTSPSSQR